MNVEWFVGFLEGPSRTGQWTTAAEVLRQARLEVTENAKRKVRAWADASGGRVAGHQKGYKLVTQMTGEEYQWWRNEMLKASDAIKGRVLESDKIFYQRKAA